MNTIMTGLVAFQKLLHHCAFDESSLGIRRVTQSDCFYVNAEKKLGLEGRAGLDANSGSMASGQ